MSSFRGTKALLMQLVRSNVSPESRPEIFKALVCIAYLVSLLCSPPCKLRLAVQVRIAVFQLTAHVCLIRRLLVSTCFWVFTLIAAIW